MCRKVPLMRLILWSPWLIMLQATSFWEDKICICGLWSVLFFYFTFDFFFSRTQKKIILRMLVNILTSIVWTQNTRHFSKYISCLCVFYRRNRSNFGVTFALIGLCIVFVLLCKHVKFIYQDITQYSSCLESCLRTINGHEWNLLHIAALILPWWHQG